jgi:acetyltransferase-like isoleucine patch superfamily enzyme
MFRLTLGIVVAFLPRRIKALALRSLFGFAVDRSANIGFSLVVPRRLTMAPNSKIGHLTVIKGVSEVVLGESATIGNLNWITGFPVGTDSAAFADQPTRQGRLTIGDHAAITNRHLVDCTDAVDIGRFATFAGFGSQILTHSISVAESRQRCRPVQIGDYAFVGTASVVLPGARLPAYSILGAGSVLNKEYVEEDWLYAGSPALPVRKLNRDAAYFQRTTGFVI